MAGVSRPRTPPPTTISCTTPRPSTKTQMAPCPTMAGTGWRGWDSTRRRIRRHPTGTLQQWTRQPGSSTRCRLAAGRSAAGTLCSCTNDVDIIFFKRGGGLRFSPLAPTSAAARALSIPFSIINSYYLSVRDIFSSDRCALLAGGAVSKLVVSGYFQLTGSTGRPRHHRSAI